MPTTGISTGITRMKQKERLQEEARGEIHGAIDNRTQQASQRLSDLADLAVCF